MTDEAQSGTNTADEQRRAATGRPFVKGDKRINRKGRPKSFDQLRALAQKISHEPIADGSTITAAEAILRTMAHDNPARFIEIAFGKVPDITEQKGTIQVVVTYEDKHHIAESAYSAADDQDASGSV
jgi:hypothetical protein